MANHPDYYRLLHVQADAPTAIIKASHRTLMQRLKMHPDLGGDHAQAVLLNEALETLTDPDKRAAYDRILARERQTSARTDSSSTSSEARPTAPRPAPAQTASPKAAAPREDSPAAAPKPRQAPAPRPMAACTFCGAPVAAPTLEWPESACHACGSALFPAQQQHAGEASRRTLERLPRSMPLTFRHATSRHIICSGTTEDVSLNGARFVAHGDVVVGERLSIECQFCSAVAIVKSVRTSASLGAGRCQVGVEFVALRIKLARGGLVSTVA